ncbi:hypothetical protein B0H16DRAFT_1726560 [Mycena metata]|uniref:C2 domain-containing protein n=1 Tax=Mycena metata TaxID=1033252 RepID=A0AAD7INT5_9AGAR|nr:hypothetical protein B0H16DRAFT_1726560 [Mycena metata]
MSKDLELGTLVIVVLKAKNLNDKYFWKQDVFAQVGLNGDTKRTKVDVKGGQHPMWDEEIRFPVMKGTGDKARKLEVSCWAKEPKKEENIGQGFVDLTETLKTGEFDDWVALETKGPNGTVSRGEIYLEMTFFTNAPAPVGLSVPKANNLQRRPSKLSPAERMARPPHASPPASLTAGHPHSHQEDPRSRPANGLSPSPPRGPSRTGRDSSLPPVPQQLAPNHPAPNTHTPGRLGAPGLTQVPSILRPRNPKSSPTPIPGPVVEYNSVVPPQGQAYGGQSPPRTYTPVVPPPDAAYDDRDAYVPPLAETWGSNDSSAEFSFPVPTLPGARGPTVEYSTPPYNPPPPAAYNGSPPALDRHGSGGSTASYSTPPPFQPSQPPFQPPPQANYHVPGAYPPSFQPPPPSFQQPPQNFQSAPPPSFQPPPAHRNNDLPDPYLLARYQSPLPLPPGADKPRERSSSHSYQDKPAPAEQSKPTPASQSNPDNARLQALRQVEEEAARRKEQELKETARLQALRQAEEEEAARRKEQELKEIARLQALRKEEEAAAARRKEQELKDNARLQALRKEEEAAAARRKEQEVKDKARLQALRKAEEEAARRRAQERTDRELAMKQFEEEAQRVKTQEEKDLELARQLDRELNLGEGA